MKWPIFAVLVALLAGCNAFTTPEPTPSPTPVLCFGFVLETAITCLETTANTAVLQSDLSEGVTIHDAALTITLRGTLLLSRTPDSLTVSALEGSSVVSMTGRTRVLQAGQRLQLAIVDGVIQQPDDAPQHIQSQDVTAVSLTGLPRPIATPVPVEVTPEITTEPTGVPVTVDVTAAGPIPATSNVCAPREDWANTYTVKAGDVLQLIAERHGATVLEMVRANCLNNPGRLSIGQILRVPGAAPTLTPSAIAFRADVTTLAPGECTVLRWDVYNVQAVYIGEEETTGSNVQRVCPQETTTYTLRVIYPDNSETTRDLIISIANP